METKRKSKVLVFKGLKCTSECICGGQGVSKNGEGTREQVESMYTKDQRSDLVPEMRLWTRAVWRKWHRGPGLITFRRERTRSSE